MGWLMKKVEKHVEAKLSGSAEAIEQIRSDASTGESHAFVLTPGGVTQVQSEQAVQDHLADQLARLGALHDRGALSDAEYEEQKRQLTGS